MDTPLFTLIAIALVGLLYLIGLISAVDAIMKARTAQGATAWALALVFVPYFSLPMYWVFGRSRFEDYADSLRTFDAEVESRLAAAREGVLKDWIVDPRDETDERLRGELLGFQRLSTLPFTRGNDARLLINGEATFGAIFDAIDQAREYVLAQFFIIHDDALGRRFQHRLQAAAARGVRVYLLYDEVGCVSLPEAYKQQLRDAGVQVSGFTGQRSWLGRFRLNFRNHRKIVVVDGRQGFVGGLNVGDEYLYGDARHGAFRDTHLAVQGPVVQGLQSSFARDWYYGSQETPELQWTPEPAERDRRALILASGPSDPLETCGLLFAHAFESAERRVWIASPYFVPDARVLGTLQLAALRGVDVRILTPRRSDNFVFHYVPYAYLPQAEQVGVKIYLYEEGFMHQKVFVVDDDYAAVGTANLDNRSFALNFEVTCLLNDADFCGEVAAMLEQDFLSATRLTPSDLADRTALFRLATQLTRLLSPIL